MVSCVVCAANALNCPESCPFRVVWPIDASAGYSSWGAEDVMRNYTIKYLRSYLLSVSDFDKEDCISCFEDLIRSRKCDGIQGIYGLIVKAKEEFLELMRMIDFYASGLPLVDSEPAVSDLEPDVSDLEPHVSDLEPHVSDPEPDVSDPETDVVDPEPGVVDLVLDVGWGEIMNSEEGEPFVSDEDVDGFVD